MSSQCVVAKKFCRAIHLILMDGYNQNKVLTKKTIFSLLGVLFPKNHVILLGIMVLHSDGNQKNEETDPSQVLLFSSVGHGSLSILVTPCKVAIH